MPQNLPVLDSVVFNVSVAILEQSHTLFCKKYFLEKQLWLCLRVNIYGAPDAEGEVV